MDETSHNSRQLAQVSVLATLLESKLCSGMVASGISAGQQTWIMIEPKSITTVCQQLKDDPHFSFDFLRSIAAVDYGDHLEICYLLFSYRYRQALTVKTRVPSANPHILSVSQIWPAANWHEREQFDLLGVIFDQHPELRRIMLPDDWLGHPLRKTYREADHYQGISTVREYLTGFPKLPLASSQLTEEALPIPTPAKSVS